MSTVTKRHWLNTGWLINLAFCLVFLIIYPGLGAASQVAVVDASLLNVRSGPGPQHDVSDQVTKGERLPVLEQRGDWYKVRLASGSTGWVAGWMVTIEEEASKQVVIRTGVLNVRGGPGIGNAVVGEVHSGDKLQVLDVSGDWYKVELPGGSSGWVAGWLVEVEEIQAKETGQPSENTEIVNKQAVVNTGSLNVRSGPGTSNDIVARVGNGDKLPIIESSGGWCKVRLPGGKVGWVAGWLVDIEGTPVSGANTDTNTGTNTNTNTGTSTDYNTDNVRPNENAESISKEAVVKEETLNVRSGPGTSNDIVAQVKKGDKFPIIDSSGGWCKVRLSGGGTGWVAGWLVDVKAISRQPDEADSGEDPSEPEGTGEETGVDEDQSLDEDPGLDTGSDPGESEGESKESDPGSGDEPGRDEEDAAEPRLTELHVREADGRVMVNIAAATPMEHNIFTLTGPDRLVVDLIGVEPGDIPEEMDVSGKLVSRLRTGWFDKNPNTVRLVFDVEDSVLFSAEPGNDGKELALEIYVPELGDFLRNKVVAIDPGHGGSEPGTHGSSGIDEKHINLDVALLTAHLLRQNGARVVLTRSEDTFVGLEERTDIARRAGADIFVSIHMNANIAPSKSGTSTYYREDDITGLGVSQADNLNLARQVQNELVKSLGRRDLGVKQANFVVLRTAVMPAVLTEVSFLSNPEEEKLLMTDSYKSRAAEGITKGIANYFAQKAG